MHQVNIHEAKTHLSKLIDAALKGEPFIIAKAGRPLVKVIALEPPIERICRLGFLSGQFTVPDHFNTMAAEEIDALFGGE